LATRTGTAKPLQKYSVSRGLGAVHGWVNDERGSLVIAAVIWFSIVYLIVPPEDFTGSFNRLYTGEPNVLYRSIKLLLIAGSGVMILWRGALSWLLLKFTNKLFLFCLILIPSSFLWSIDPSATLARVATLASIVLVCYAFVLVGWSAHRFQNVVRPIITLLLVASLLYGIVFPDIAIEQGDDVSLKNAWRGLTYQKNQFGVLASITAVFWLHAFLTKETKLWISAFGLFVAGLCIVLSRSSSAFLATGLTFVFMCVLLFLPGNFRRWMPYIVGTFATVVVVYAVAVLRVVPGLDALLTPIAEMFGKDLTFSNRSEIWAIMKEHIQLRPWLGSGYGAFWVGPVPSSPSYVFLDRMNFYPTESHNGYLEVVSDLGFIGFIGLIGYLITFVRQSLAVMRFDRNQGVLYLCLFFQQAIGNLSESYWLQLGFSFTVLTLATFSSARAFLDNRLKEYFVG